MKHPLIEFREVTKCFGDKKVLNRVNLKIYENEITTIIGKSGTGKTVLLKHIIGLLKPDEGEVLFAGRPLSNMKRHEWRRYKRQISYLFQHNALFDSMTVFDNVALPLVQTTSLKTEEVKKRVMTRLEQTELGDVAHSYPAQLSGGMQKRAALARALVTDPRIVLFDEPTTGQDPIRKNVILSMVAAYRRRFGFTAVLISHDIPDVFFVSDRVVLLWEGAVGFEGTYEEAIRLSHPMIAEFVQSLEGLQGELTGLLSREAFRSCYASLFSEGATPLVTSAILFTVELRPETESGQTVEAPPPRLLAALGEHAARHFRQVGGFSLRYGGKHILTVLPHTSGTEAEQLMSEYARELDDQAKTTIEEMSQPDGGSRPALPIVMMGGVSEVSVSDDIDTIVANARGAQRTLPFVGE